jgi:DeoR/GlpR family transcriptional regulator of sugar metabolism
MADHSKLGQKASFFFAEVADLSCLITDKEADTAFVAELEAKGVEVLVEK